MGKKEIKGLDSRVNIHFVSYRYRLTDPDGISGKAAIDGLVHAGILSDDSAKEINQVTYSQNKIPAHEQERTEIIIEEK